jgi:hypothetical protein
MIRMLIVGYVFAIRSERALCRELRVNLAYRWFCGLSIEDKVPDHSGVHACAQRTVWRQRHVPACGYAEGAIRQRLQKSFAVTVTEPLANRLVEYNVAAQVPQLADLTDIHRPSIDRRQSSHTSLRVNSQTLGTFTTF